jgi:hypothetical protein
MLKAMLLTDGSGQRYDAASWTDSNVNVWLFGGSSVKQPASFAFLPGRRLLSEPGHFGRLHVEPSGGGLACILTWWRNVHFGSNHSNRFDVGIRGDGLEFVDSVVPRSQKRDLGHPSFW